MSQHTRSTPTLIDLLASRAAEQGSQTGFTFHSDSAADVLTYAELDRRARGIAALLLDQGLGGARAVLMYPPGVDYICAFFACLYAGVVAVPAYPPASARTLGRLHGILDDAATDTILTTGATLARLRSGVMDEAASAGATQAARRRWVCTDGALPDAHDWRRPDLGPDQLAFLQYTSGSTSAPKGVRLTHANLLANLAIIRDAFRLHRDSRGVIWLPPYHDMGLIGGILAPLFTGFPVALMAPVSFLKRPERWLELISSERATCSGGPNFAYELCVQKATPELLETLDLRDWEVAFCGAEPIRAGTLAGFAAAFAPAGLRQAALYPCYGLAEATLMVSGGEASAAPVIARFQEAALQSARAVPDPDGRALVGSGRVRPGMSVEVRGPDGAVLDDGAIGEICIAGPSVSAGYWNAPPRADAWFATGDLGFLLQGELFVTGRSKEMLIIRGRNYYPQDIEAAVQASHAALESGAGVAFTDAAEGLVVVQEVRRAQRKADLRPVLVSIREAIAGEFQLQASRIVLVGPGTLEKTSSGKLQRSVTRQRYLRGELSALPEQAADAREHLDAGAAATDPLGALLAGLAGLAPHDIGEHNTLAQLGLDSLKMVQAFDWLARRSDVTLDELMAGVTVGQLRARVKHAGSSAAEPMAEMEAPGATYPLGSEQRQFWLLDPLLQSMGAGHASHITARIALDGEPDVAQLRGTLQALTERQPLLRTSYHLRGAEPYQQVGPAWAPDLPLLDLSAFDETQRARLAERALQALAEEAFDLALPRPLRTVLLRHDERKWELGVILHHIAADFFSLAPMLRSLTPAGADIRGRYRLHLQAPRAHAPAALAYWQAALADAPATVRWDGATPAPVAAAVRRRRYLAPADWERVRRHAREHDLTPFALLFGAFQMALHATGGQPDLVSAVVVSNRGARQDDTLGCFIDVLPLRSSMAEVQSARAFVQQVRASFVAGMRHRLPFEQLGPILRARARAPGAALLNAAFVMQSLEPLPLAQLGGVAARFAGTVAPTTTHQDLRLTVGESQCGQGISLDWDFKGALASAVERIDAMMRGALEAILQDGSVRCEPMADPVSAAPAPAGVESTEAAGLPALERALTRQWCAALGIADAGLHDGFFALGGTSMGLVRLWSELNDTYAVTLPQKLFFSDEPTIAVVARLLAEQGITAPPVGMAEAAPAAARAPAPSAAPASPTVTPPRPIDRAQTLHELVRELFPEQPLGHVLAVRAVAESDQARLLACWRAALAASPDLRLDPLATPDGVLPAPASGAVAPHRHVDFSQAGADAVRAWLQQQLAQEFAPDLPLLRTFSIETAGRMLFGCVAHPLALDKADLERLMDQLERLAAGQAPQAPAAASDPLLALEHILPERATLDFPGDRSRPARPGFAVGRVQLDWPDALAAPASAVLFAAFQVWVFRLGAQDRFWLGKEGRAVPVALSHALDFQSLCARPPHAMTLAAALELAGEQGLPQHHPVFQLGFETLRAPSLGAGVDCCVEPQPSRSLLDLTLKAGPAGMILDYSTELFDADTAQRLLRHYLDLLTGLLEQPALTIGRQRFFASEPGGWQGPPAAVPPQYLLTAFAHNAARLPDKPALYGSAGRIAYRELEEGANQLAHHLRELGVSGDSLVGICVERGPFMLLAMLAVLKSGAAYLPLDPAFPRERLDYIMGDAGVSALLTEEALRARLACSGPVVTMEHWRQRRAGYPTTAPDLPHAPQALAYVIYTSGSTGLPKGVMVSRAALDNFLLSMRQRPGLAQDDVLAAVTTLSFDIAGLELFLPLTVGASIALVAREEGMHGPTLKARIEGASAMQATPVTWKLLLDAGWTPALPFKILCGGEALAPALAARLLDTGAEVWNMYGPTETTIWSTVQQVRHGEPVTLGAPIHNTALYVLDQHGEPAAPGCPGELCIGGLGLARGYWRRPELTAQRFIAHPEQPGQRLYRTGDLVRLQRGCLHYLGRNDHQVKIRGFRVELEEIEQVLAQTAAVSQAVVLPWRDGEETRLAAYLPRGVEQPDLQLRQALMGRLPTYMIPSRFTWLDVFPLTLNGKIDRSRLAPPAAHAPPPVAARSDTERLVARLFCQWLGRDTVGVDDDFFSLGGDHWALLQVYRQLCRETGVREPLALWFGDRLTVAALAARFDLLQLQDLDPGLLANLLGELDLH